MPRAYQREAFINGMKHFEDGKRETLIISATGTGKTFMASQFVAAIPGNALWLNDRIHLVGQVRDELAGMLNRDVWIEQGDTRAPSHGRVVVGCVPSMAQPKRLAQMDPKRFSLIVVDEAHHCLASTYQRILGHFPEAKVLLVTATPDPLTGIESVCLDYQWLRAIGDGYLVPVRLAQARRIDVSRIKTSGEFSDDQVAEVMGDDVIRGMCDDIVKLAMGQRGVLYMPRVDVAHIAAGVLNTLVPGCARAIDGSQEDHVKAALMKGHKAGEFPYLVNVGMVVEGHDDSGIMWIGHGRPSKSRVSVTQTTGRGGRPLCAVDQYDTSEARRAAIASSPKPHVLVFDFVGNLGKHKLQTLVDVMAPKDMEEAVKKRARDLLDKDSGGDVEKAIATAQRLTQQERQEEVARVARVEAARFEWKIVDPFTAFGMPGQTDVATALTRATQAERAMLFRAGVDVTPSLTKTDAQRLIRAVKARERAGLASFGQIKILSRHGIQAQRMYAKTARRLMDAIARHNGWTPPKETIDAIISNRG